MSNVKIERKFTKEGVSPYADIEFKSFDAVIKDYNSGEEHFRQDGVIFPDYFSQTAVDIVTNKYFYGHVGEDDREHDLRQLIDRVIDKIAQEGHKAGYFQQDGMMSFADELKYMAAHQIFAFNSPVWFNIGTPGRQQSSACFINSICDSMESICELQTAEASIFKWGSGAGTNLSPLRAKGEPLKGGGESSGPISFMKGFDAFGGVIKSGGKKRRAAKMIIIDDTHPDVEEFIWCKVSEEAKAKVLIDAGYDGGFNVEGGAYEAVFFQNANHSIRVSDDFMSAVMSGDDDSWHLTNRTDGSVAKTVKAKNIMRQMAEACWKCGDPGVQFDGEIQRMHGCKNDGRINASNPCSEYLHLDDTSCNLASLNLLMFHTKEGFSWELYEHANRIVFIAQDILAEFSEYPTEKIAETTVKYRTIGLGFTNLGALLMANGLGYDSPEGRAFASTITATMNAVAYKTSAELAKVMGPFERFEANREPMLVMLDNHMNALSNSADTLRGLLGVGESSGNLAECDPFIASLFMQTGMAVAALGDAQKMARVDGLRNAQATVLAPTGTISFFMDAVTTGIEPELSIIKYKKLVGGGSIKIVNPIVSMGLRALGYDTDVIQAAREHAMEHGHLEGFEKLNEEHLHVFDTSFKPQTGDRSLGWMSHLQMMAACQPHISGAISKTINMPEEATVEEIEEAYIAGWRMGLKAIAVYRNNCKLSQPLSTSLDEDELEDELQSVAAIIPKPKRRRMPSTRDSVTHKFNIGGHEGYFTVGKYDNGEPGELFIRMSKQGSTIAGLLDAFATSVSLNLQHGVSVESLVSKFAHMRFEPAGYTDNEGIRFAKSIVDYIFTWFNQEFVLKTPTPTIRELNESVTLKKVDDVGTMTKHEASGPPCQVCGAVTVPAGSCHTCPSCGATTGCG